MNRAPQIFLYILAFLLLPGFSQSEDPSEELIYKSWTYIDGLKDLSAKFHYQIESPHGKKISQNGLILFKDLRYILKMEKYDIYYDGSSHTIYSSALNQYRVMTNNPAQNIGLVSYVYSVYRKPSDKEYLGEEEVNGKLMYKIHFKMKDHSVPYDEAVLWLNQDNMLIEKISFIDLKKTITTYTFSDIRTNPGFEHSDFIFDSKQFPGSEEIDED